MAGKADVVAFAKKNQTITIVGVGAALVTAWIAFRSFAGGGSSTAVPTPAPAATPGPVDTTSGGGGASSGIDLASLVAALSGSQQSGADSGVALGQAGLQAGVDLGTAGLQTGAQLGVAGLEVGQNLGLGALGLAQGVTDTLGNALQVSVSAQAGQTTAVTGSLTSLIGRLLGPGSVTLGKPKTSKPTYQAVNTTTATAGKVTSTKIGTGPTSSLKTKPGITTPVGHIAPPAFLGPPAKKPPAKANVKPIRL